MIYSLKIVDPTATPIPWLPKVEALKAPREFTFTPGLNIIWGRNGTGKSSLLTLLARIFHCAQSGFPVITTSSLEDLFATVKWDDNGRLERSVSIRHDGQGVRHFDPGHTVGLLAFGGAFDDDFSNEGFAAVKTRGSAGQMTAFKSDKLLKTIKNGETPAVKCGHSAQRVNDVWETRKEVAQHLLAGNADKGPPTILLDEPDRSFDLPMQLAVWKFLRIYADETQFIVASHCPFALNLPEANYIDIDPGYLELAQKTLAILPKWPSAKPRRVQ